MDKVNLLASPGLALIHTPFRSLICSPVLSSILISVMGYKAGAIIVVKPTAPTLLSGLTKIKKYCEIFFIALIATYEIKDN